MAATSPATATTAGPHRDRSSSPQNAAATGTIGIAIRYPISVGSEAGRPPSASLATMMPTRTSSRISRTPSAASKLTPIRRFRAVISSAYPASARPTTMIVVGTAPFTDDMLLRFVVRIARPQRVPGTAPDCFSAAPIQGIDHRTRRKQPLLAPRPSPVEGNHMEANADSFLELLHQLEDFTDGVSPEQAHSEFDETTLQMFW